MMLLQERSKGICELCAKVPGLVVYKIFPESQVYPEGGVLLCEKCNAQVEKREDIDAVHWQSLTETMWSEVPEVQVMAWRMLNRLKDQSWAADCLDMLYLEEEILAWAKAAGDQDDDGVVLLHRDSNGNVLNNGDTVILTKSLDVKGTALNAKMGTVVKNIRLVENNTDQIEGKIEGQMIVILTKYLRKQGA